MPQTPEERVEWEEAKDWFLKYCLDEDMLGLLALHTSPRIVSETIERRSGDQGHSLAVGRSLLQLRNFGFLVQLDAYRLLLSENGAALLLDREPSALIKTQVEQFLIGSRLSPLKARSDGPQSN